jgi:hypothetical protein
MDDTEAKYMVEFPDNEHGMIVVSDATPHQAALKACRSALGGFNLNQGAAS